MLKVLQVLGSWDSLTFEYERKRKQQNPELDAAQPLSVFNGDLLAVSFSCAHAGCWLKSQLNVHTSRRLVEVTRNVLDTQVEF